MDSGIDKDQQPVNESYTEFGGTRQNSWYNPSNRLGKFFSKFFATKAKPALAAEFQDEDMPLAGEKLRGDTLVNTEILKPTDTNRALGTLQRNTLPISQNEIDRRTRYNEFEQMDNYPEIATSFDVYADDSTQRDTENRRWIIESEDEVLKEEVEKLFRRTKLDLLYWDIVRNICKYGDCFTESVVNLENPKAGIQKLKILNPNYIFRVENEYGYLTDFLQEIPDNQEWSTYSAAMSTMKARAFVTLDKNQITHFRIHTSNPEFYPYGKSIAAGASSTYRSLKLMEDAMLIYRLSRAPERRIFYIDTGNMPATKAQMYMEKLKEKFKKEKFYDKSRGNIDSRYNPISFDEDFYFPVKKGSMSKVETLPGAQNLGEVDDVKYFRDKLLARLKIPKDYIVEKDKSPERKANLSQLDVKFAKVIVRVQQCMEVGLESLAKRHLLLKGFPSSMINDMRIRLPEPSDMFAKRKFDLEDQKSRVVTAVQGLNLFDDTYIYEKFYNMSNTEIEDMKGRQEEYMKKQMEQQAMGDPMLMEGGGGMPGEEVIPGGEPMIGAPSPMGGGEESAENIPPTNESCEIKTLNMLRRKMILEGRDDSKISVISNRIIRLNKQS